MSAKETTGVNLEFKARLTDPAALEPALRNLGAQPTGILHQRDTYFGAAAGRLKLREQDGRCELIAYKREDAAADRWSRYTVTPVPDASAAIETLAATHGLRGVVTKSRRLWLYENARIHIDAVEGLGDFIEFEVVNPRTDAEAHALLTKLLSALTLDPTSSIAGSYIDLLEDLRRRS